MIARVWRGRVRTEDGDAYVSHVEETGIAQYRSTPATSRRTCSPGTWMTAAPRWVTLSSWSSLDAVRGFAGDDVTRAVLYPEDDRFLVDREVTVAHYDVHDGA
ncbi:hypothetical protein [Geodermatophilus sp. SYSU D01176]